ncbi:MAG: protein-L-isoaspartate(D-aspartate) O-methyltransferase [Clostridia bacterium]|nr:protein-L-isoaspartate(D-aspartate) O-methyltransferase [Clostridia bacterium]
MKPEEQKKNLDEFFYHLDRSVFIEGENKRYAGYDEALSIGYEQTISMPSLVHYMTSKLQLDKRHRVLEIGTGSGYQTAFLAEFGGKVFTVERIKELSWKAVERLMNMGYKNIQFKIGDGSEGWPEFAPYDRIMVTAAAGSIPEILVDQLANDGRMLVPIGPKGLQDLILITKDSKGRVEEKNLGDVTFVELKGEYGWKS